ncbi:MAG: hypothetical protein EP335_14175 [Alphaproteobacteria bacterium]|nr:MAG: hypothetical protein EP335_14175 [Alphaproteobacteria bacterium]
MRILSTLFLGLFVLAVPAHADSVTPWQDHQDMVRTRLVAASSDMAAEAGALYAWEAELADGWKTYWRSPGEAGLPVRLRDGEGADAKDIDILYPLPHRFNLFGLETYGYSHRVMLPFRLPAGATGTVEADFMVCKDICVPFRATYSLPATPPETTDDVRIGAWLKQVPARDGDGGVGLKVGTLRLTGTPGHQRLVVDIAADVALSDGDLMAEVNDMVHFGAPEKRLLADGKSMRFVLDAMTGNKPFDLKGQKVRLTVTDGHGHAIDRTLEIPN